VFRKHSISQINLAFLDFFQSSLMHFDDVATRCYNETMYCTKQQGSFKLASAYFHVPGGKQIKF